MKELQQQVEEARGSLTETQGAIEASVEGLLTTRVAQTIALFNQSVEEIKQQISQELRSALATDLISVANGFVKQPRTEFPPTAK